MFLTPSFYTIVPTYTVGLLPEVGVKLVVVGFGQLAVYDVEIDTCIAVGAACTLTDEAHFDVVSASLNVSRHFDGTHEAGFCLVGGWTCPCAVAVDDVIG